MFSPTRALNARLPYIVADIVSAPAVIRDPRGDEFNEAEQSLERSANGELTPEETADPCRRAHSLMSVELNRSFG